MITQNAPTKTMRAATVKQHGGTIDADIQVVDDFPRPALRRKKGEMIIRVLACSLAPGDLRVHRGDCDLLQSPGFFPYVPGGDVCGYVEEVEPGAPFKKGDVVISMFGPTAAGPGPAGGLAEYCAVLVAHSVLKPESVSEIDGAAMASSALTAYTAVRHVRAGDRVLVIGGSGGVGCHLLQLLKAAGASHVATTSTQAELTKSLGADVVIDYRTQHWWDLPAYQRQPFDIVFDLMGGMQGWPAASRSGAVKRGSRGGRWVTTAPDDPHFPIHSTAQALGCMLPILGRASYSRLAFWSAPKYTYHLGIEPKRGNLQGLAQAVADGKLKIVLDPASPLPFTTEGVRRAFHVQDSKHAHGKVVVQIAKA
jgi:NADPH:quinone reductase-like Zn-dependent oxidoreductase